MLKKYLGVKVVFASEMTADEAEKKHYRVSQKERNGYEVTYEDGYKSWCPKTVFEKNNVEMEKIPLAESVQMMLSKDYKERFVSEYVQIKVRTNKLGVMLWKWKNSKLDFTPKCSFELLSNQLKAMNEYIDILELRAKIEKVELPCLDEKETSSNA